MALCKDGHALRLDLEALAEAEVQQLLESALGDRMAELERPELDALEHPAVAEPIARAVLERVASRDALIALERRGLIVRSARALRTRSRCDDGPRGKGYRAGKPGLP